MIERVDHMIALNKEMTTDPFKYFIPASHIKIIDAAKSPTGVDIYSDDPRAGAYVHANDSNHKIHTGPALFYNPNSGGTPNSTAEFARLLSHETSHFDFKDSTGLPIKGTTDKFNDSTKDASGNQPNLYQGGDYIYGTNESKKLSDTKPHLAPRHADTVSYFISGLGTGPSSF